MKENANPTIYNVTKAGTRRNKEFYNKLIANKAVSRFSFDPNHINTLDTSCIPTPVERTTHLALKSLDRGENKEYDPLSLLRLSGMIPSVEDDEETTLRSHNRTMDLPSIFEQCYFIPSNARTEEKISITANRDPIESDEIFDIIRNIQDPEHPLTLEQLNVVNLDHISVKDVTFGEGDSDEYSSVDVKFT